MIRCHCCEHRLGHSLDECGCVPEYCPKCSLCKSHCSCTPSPVRVGFLKLVAIIAACLSLGAMFGALVADNNGYNPWLLAGAGAVVGIAFGLVAAGESRGRWLDPFFPPGKER